MKIAVAADETRGQISNEARILSELGGQGIPALYDAAEDGNSVCLIEEYIPGVSLESYISEHSLSGREVFSIIEKTADILSILHTAPGGPILYLDLKPEHLIMKGERLCLIDYGSARRMPKSGNNPDFVVYGTYGYTAPECLGKNKAGTASDIYSLAMVARELYRHSKSPMPPKIAALLERAGHPDPENRPESAEQFKKMWQDGHGKKKNGGLLFENAAVIGAGHSSGATHVAIALTVYLNYTGQRAYYQNRSKTPVTRYLAKNLKALSQKGDGLLKHASFAAIMDRGPAAEELKVSPGIRITDCGTDQNSAFDSDVIIYVLGSCPWREIALPNDAILGSRTAVILNPGKKALGIAVSKAIGRKVFGFPPCDDPFVMTEEKERFFKELQRELLS